MASVDSKLVRFAGTHRGAVAYKVAGIVRRWGLAPPYDVQEVTAAEAAVMAADPRFEIVEPPKSDDSSAKGAEKSSDNGAETFNGTNWDVLGVTEDVAEALATKFGTVEALKAATDDDLLAIGGVGAATLKKIREATK